MKNVLVIGGTKGIGGAIAESYRLTGDRVRDASRKGWFELDLSWDPTIIEQQMNAILLSIFPTGLDRLVLSAGMGAYVNRYFDPDKLKDVFRVNVFGRILAYRQAYRFLGRSKGSALFIGSTVAKYGAKGLELYGAAMAANEGFVVSEAHRARRNGVRVNVLSPGWVRTPMTDEMREDYKEAARRWMPIGRMLEPEEVAHKAREVLEGNGTGQVIPYLGEDLTHGSE